MEEKKDATKTKTYDPITEFTYEAIDTRYKETVIKSLLETKKALDAKVKECEERAEAEQKVQADFDNLRLAMEATKRQYEEKLTEVKTQLGQGLNNESDPRKTLQEGIKIIEDKKRDVVSLPIEFGRGERPRPKLDSNTPSFSGKPGERLDEWLFILNTAFRSLKITSNEERLDMATVYVKEGPLKALMAYQKEAVNPNWIGFQEILRAQFEPKLLTMKVRTQLRHLRQSDSLHKYLKRFNELTVQLSNMSEEEKLVAFTDGLNEKYKFEVIRAHCKNVAEAVDVACSLDFCASKGSPEELNTLKKVNFAKFKGKYGAKYQKPYKKNNNPNNGRMNNKGPYSVPYRALMICHRCKKQGHIQKDCRVKLPESGKENSEQKKKYGNRNQYAGKKSNLLAICSNVTIIQKPEGS